MDSVSFLLGSGVSYYSKIPKVDEITNIVLSGKNINRESGSCYQFNSTDNALISENNQQYIVNNVNLCNELSENINEFYNIMNRPHKCNYEDIYYVNRQILDSYRFEFENPAILELLKYLKRKLKITDTELWDISRENSNYIKWIVSNLINKEISNYDQFNILNPLIEKYNLKTIISLNHDLVIEKFFQSSSIIYNDGFCILNRKLPEWIGFSETNSELMLLKLHGTVNWFSATTNGSNGHSIIVKIPRNTDPDRLYEIDRTIDINSGRPEILIGTFNKMWGYLHGIFEEQYFAFKNCLLNTDILIISGYGFGDKGINTKLGNWLDSDISKKMLIIHPNKRNLVLNSRGIFPLRFMSMRRQHPKISFIENKFENVTFKELNELI